MKRTRRSGVTIVTVLALLLGAAAAAAAAEVPQTITLKGGWNAVYLEVEPANPDPGVVFSGVPDLLSVWTWNPRTSPVEFLTEPAQLAPRDPSMLGWFPSNPDPNVTNLHAIYGGQGYLVHRTEGAPDFPKTISGEPVVPRIDWKPDSLNFVGFPLVAGSEPLFFDFFAGSTAHAGQAIYILDNATSSWVRVTDPSDPMQRGEAFWVFCKGDSEFNGSLGVKLDSSQGLIFGTRLVETKLTVENRSTGPLSVDLAVSSAGPHLKYLVFDPAATPAASWPDMPLDPPLARTLAAGRSTDIALGVMRAGIPAGEDRTANLSVTGGGMRILIPVSATGVDYSGLWVGDAVVKKVSQPGLPETILDPEAPRVTRPTGSEFPLRLIIHRDGAGNARLLREVLQLWSEPGQRYVLLANEARVGEFLPGAMRDGQPVGRRISSAAFGFTGFKAMAGSFALPGSLAATVVIPWDDPVNPFRHRYHPDHKLAPQTYNVTRSLGLEFTDQVPGGGTVPGATTLSWGSSEVGGIYRETILLQRGNWEEPLDPDEPYEVRVEGTFLLRRVSSIGALEY